MKIPRKYKTAFIRITGVLSGHWVDVSTHNSVMGTRHSFNNAVFEVSDGLEFHIFSDVSCPLNMVRIHIDTIKEIVEHNINRYTIVMQDDTSICIERHF